MRAMTDDELKHLFDAMRQEIGAFRHEVRDEIGTIRQAHVETRRHFDVVTEATRHEIGLVAESVALVGEKLEREATDIRQEMRTGFADTQAMIRFSHAELDRRVRTVEENQRALEDALSALQSRVERLEGSTH
jgi:predicted  nucleic acid-binding Zn-ribbon protein